MRGGEFYNWGHVNHCGSISSRISHKALSRSRKGCPASSTAVLTDMRRAILVRRCLDCDERSHCPRRGRPSRLWPAVGHAPSIAGWPSASAREYQRRLSAVIAAPTGAFRKAAHRAPARRKRFTSTRASGCRRASPEAQGQRRLGSLQLVMKGAHAVQCGRLSRLIERP